MSEDPIMNRHRKKEGASDESLDGNQLLALSLFIMLLAFFIILNALSTYENIRYRPVMDSIEAAFSSKISQRNNDRPSMAPSEQKDLSEGDTFDRLDALFTSQIPAYDSTVSRSKGVMHVELTYDAFKKAVYSLTALDTAMQDSLGGEFFLPAMIALMKNQESGQPYRMDVMLNIDNNPAALENTAPAALSKHMKELGGLATKIREAGLNENLISIGIEEGETGKVELLFRRHVPYNPLTDASGGE